MKKGIGFLEVAVVGLVAIGWSGSKVVSSCRVTMTVREDGKIPKNSGDTIMALDKGSSIGLVVNIVNKGKAQKFDVKLETEGLDITDGSLSRKATVDTGKAGSVHLVVKGKDVGQACNASMRSIRISVSPENQPKVICGQVWKNFFCPRGKKATGK